jgi:hypothetical protein
VTINKENRGGAGKGKLPPSILALLVVEILETVYKSLKY